MRGILRILIYSSVLTLSLVNKEGDKTLDRTFLSQIKTNNLENIQSNVLEENAHADLKNRVIIRPKHDVGEQRNL